MGRSNLRVTTARSPDTLRRTAGSSPKHIQSERSGKHKNPSRQPKREQQPSHDAMLVSNALVAKSKDDWIVDLGATCHMCNDRSMFMSLKQVGPNEKVTLGDGNSLCVA